MLSKDHRSADFIYLTAEKIAYKLFLGLFLKLPLSPNQITSINFFVNNLGTVFLFSLGKYWGNLLAVGLIAISEVWDWMDGAVARKRGLASKGGAFLDPAFDFTWQNLMLAGIVFGVFRSSGGNLFWLAVGLLAFVSLTLVNYCGAIYGDNFGFGFRGDYDKMIDKVDSSRKTGFFDKLCLEMLVYRKFSFIFLFTVRYSLLLGAIFNKLNYFLIFLSIAFLFKSVCLLYLFFLYLESSPKEKNLIIVQALIERHQFWLKVKNG